MSRRTDGSHPARAPDGGGDRAELVARIALGLALDTDAIAATPAPERRIGDGDRAGPGAGIEFAGAQRTIDILRSLPDGSGAAIERADIEHAIDVLRRRARAGPAVERAVGILRAVAGSPDGTPPGSDPAPSPAGRHRILSVDPVRTELSWTGIGARTLRLAVAGEICSWSVIRLEAFVTDLIECERPELVELDLSGVDFIDGRGGSWLVRLRRRTDATGIGLRMVAASAAVERLLALTGLEQVLEWAPGGGAPSPPPAATVVGRCGR